MSRKEGVDFVIHFVGMVQQVLFAMVQREGKGAVLLPHDSVLRQHVVRRLQDFHLDRRRRYIHIKLRRNDLVVDLVKLRKDALDRATVLRCHRLVVDERRIQSVLRQLRQATPPT